MKRHWVKLRIRLLKRIDTLNTELGFVGGHGEPNLNEPQLEELIKRLEKEVSKK